MPLRTALHRAAIALIVGTVALPFWQPAPVAAAEPAYMSIMMSRSTSQEADAACNAYSGTVKIADVAAGLKRRGVGTVVASLVTDWADQADTGACVPWFDSDGVRRGQVRAAGWNAAAALRDGFNWKFVSHSKTYADITKIGDALLRRQETCDTLAAFKAHGHTDAHGLFNFPNNALNAAAKAIVNTCFSYARKYGNQINTKLSTKLPPHLLFSRSVSGGRCNNPALACYNMPVIKDRRYTLPSVVTGLMNPAPGRYAIAQFYRFVSGKRVDGPGYTWDCTSRDPRDHWTTAPETWCVEDLWSVVNARSRTAVITHPAAVAKAWGRLL